MCVVVPLQDVFASIRQTAVAEQETLAAMVQIILVVALDGVGDKRNTRFVVQAMPTAAVVIAAEENRLADLCVGERFALVVVPAESCEDAQTVGDLLLGIEAKAVLDRAEGL